MFTRLPQINCATYTKMRPLDTRIMSLAFIEPILALLGQNCTCLCDYVIVGFLQMHHCIPWLEQSHIDTKIGSRYTPLRKIPPVTFHPDIFPLGMFPPPQFFSCLQLASLALGLRTLVGTGSRQRHISQSQTMLFPCILFIRGIFPGGFYPVTLIVYWAPFYIFDCFIVFSS